MSMMIKTISLFSICTFALLGTVDTKDLPADSLGSKENKLVVNDYTYSCWLNGWRKNANDESADIFGMETNVYGFTLDVADFTKVGLGLLDNPVGYEQALDHKAEKLRTLPKADLRIELELDGQWWATRNLSILLPAISRLRKARLHWQLASEISR